MKSAHKELKKIRRKRLITNQHVNNHGVIEQAISSKGHEEGTLECQKTSEKRKIFPVQREKNQGKLPEVGDI